MRTELIAGVAALGLLGSGTAAAAANPLYVGGGLAVQSATSHNDGIALSVKGGVKVDHISPGLAFEGELSQSLINPERDTFRGGSGDTSFTTLGGYAAYSVPLPNRRISLRGRVGVVWENIDPDWAGSDDELHFSWGAGAEYRISSEFSTYAEYTRIESDLGQLTGGVVVHF